MAKRRPSEIRRFYQSAVQHLEDAEILLANNRANGAIYLAGYAIECGLKALYLANVPVGQHLTSVKAFRDKIKHDLEKLRKELGNKGVQFPEGITKCLTSVNTWSVEMRYNPRRRNLADAKVVFAAASEVLHWLKEKL